MARTLLIIFVLLFSGACYAFEPWNSDMAVADELHGDLKGGVRGVTLAQTHRPVYGAFQAGAWMLIRFFQKVISPQDGPNCRYEPVCSAYAVRAVMKHGAFAGAVMAGDRLLRCNPYNPPGRDPVPDSVCGH